LLAELKLAPAGRHRAAQADDGTVGVARGEHVGPPAHRVERPLEDVADPPPAALRVFAEDGDVDWVVTHAARE
jgi:hypothetical protein